MASSSDDFIDYRKAYPARSFDRERLKYEDETAKIEAGVFDLTDYPIQQALEGEPARRMNEHGTNKHLWVIASESLPASLEESQAGANLSRGRVCHTNLTGGEAAHCGGELWFRDRASFWMNGGSGRYRPRSAEELEKIAACFRSLGYSVCCFGWDDQTNKEKRYCRRGEEVWR